MKPIAWLAAPPALAAAFIFVWPTPYVIEGSKRINRFTGKVEFATSQGWQPASKLAKIATQDEKDAADKPTPQDVAAATTAFKSVRFIPEEEARERVGNLDAQNNTDWSFEVAGSYAEFQDLAGKQIATTRFIQGDLIIGHSEELLAATKSIPEAVKQTVPEGAAYKIVAHILCYNAYKTAGGYKSVDFNPPIEVTGEMRTLKRGD